jgi:hypothetical protein
MGVLDRRLKNRLRERIMEEKRRQDPRWLRELRHEMFAHLEPAILARGKAEGRREGKAEGEAKGKREALLLVLKGRGLAITQAQRAAIRACEDPAELDRWVAASGKVVSVQELLAGTRRATSSRSARTPGTA